MIQSRFYTVSGMKFEARFFTKGEVFPETNQVVPKQGIWGCFSDADWTEALYLGTSWRFINLDVAVNYMPDR